VAPVPADRSARIDYTGTLWEKMSPTGMTEIHTGSDPIESNSLARGWAAAPTTQPSETGGGHVVAVEG
jgi:hypothetical protein